MFNGNKITYYNRYFIECEKDPEIKPEYIYAIWRLDYPHMYHIASFKTIEQLDAFAKMFSFQYEWDEEQEGYKDGHISRRLVEAKDTVESSYWLDKMCEAADKGDCDGYKVAGKRHDAAFNTMCGAYAISPERLSKAKWFKGLSNGSIVDNLYVDEGDEVRIYRCNPNSKEFYHPMPLEEHIEWERIHGTI